MSEPRTGNGNTSGKKPSWRDLFMRRGTEANKGATSDVQPLATARFRRDAGAKQAKADRKSRWFE